MFQLGGKFGIGRSGQNVEDQLDSAHIGGEARAKLARAVGALVSLALLLLPARSADRKESLLLGFAGRLSCSLGSFRGRSLCGFARYHLAPGPLSFRDPDVAGGDNLRSSLHSPQPSGVFRNCPGTFKLSLLRSAGST